LHAIEGIRKLFKTRNCFRGGQNFEAVTAEYSNPFNSMAGENDIDAKAKYGSIRLIDRFLFHASP
uniref:Oxidoreductase n=1 Tax=Angiostrongylus cantonensis TaxID=6313 RepID=A0A0K0D433_ANGCA